MSILKNLVNDVSYALNKKKMKNLRTKQIEIKELRQQLIYKNFELKEKTEKLKTLNIESLELLKKHNYHQQNLHAKKIGLKSGIQYKIKIHSAIANIEREQKNLNIQQEKYENDLKKNQEELVRTNNTILFYNNLQITTILGCFTSLLITLCYILLLINPKSLFENLTNFIVYSATLIFLVLTATAITFLYDKLLYKKLGLGRLNFCNYMFAIFLIANVLLVSMPANFIKPYIIFIIYLLIAFSIFNILIKNELTFKINKDYCFPLDFTMFNLPFVNFTAVTIINSIFIGNNLLCLAIKVIYAISVVTYIILFIWEAMTNWSNKVGIKQLIFLTISVLLVLAFTSCAIMNFLSDISQIMERIATIAGIISLFSPLYRGFKRSSENDTKTERH